MVSWGTRRFLARVHAVRDLDRIMAGYNPKPPTPSDRDPVLLAVCDAWCGGDLEAADWVVRRIWLRERVNRWAKFLPFVLLAVLAPGLVAKAAVLAVGLVVTRTSRARLMQSTSSWAREAKLHERMLKRFGRDLPASILLDEWTFRRLVPSHVSPAEREVLETLSREWHGTVGALLDAAPRLAH